MGEREGGIWVSIKTHLCILSCSRDGNWMKIMFTFGSFSSIDECSMFTEQFFFAVCCSLARACSPLIAAKRSSDFRAREEDEETLYFFLYFSNIGYFQVVEKC